MCRDRGNDPPPKHKAEMTDTQDLAARAISGDAQAFEGLVRQYSRLVWAVIYGEIHDPGWTEDLVQETFLRAWKSIGQLESPSAFKPWMLSIARRLAFRHRELARSTLSLANEPVAPAPRPLAEEDEAPQRVHAAIQKLPERERLPVILRFLNGMNHAEISQTLQLSNGALRGLLNRGMARLRRELAPLAREGVLE